MEATIQSQIYIFLITLVGGMLIAFAYDLYRLLRYYFRPKRVKTQIQDLLFWIFLSIGIIIFVNRVNEGELRGFIFIGFTIGILLYSRLLSKTVIKYIRYIVNFTIDKIKLVLGTIFSPFKTVTVKLKSKIKNMKRYLGIPKKCYNNTRKSMAMISKKK